MFINKTVVNMFLNRPFILASNSSSRSRLLKSAGLCFKKISPLCDEDYLKKQLIKKINKKKLPRYLAKEKALSVSKKKPEELVVGSDTIIIINNKIINKAKTFNEAKQKLKKLSGKKHQIISGASVCYKKKQIWSCQQTSTIKIKNLNDKEIEKYLSFVGKDILSSVGCYQAEKLGPQIIQSIKGDYFNVLGFPLFPFMLFLSKTSK